MVCQTILLFDLDQSLPLSDSNLGENDLNQNLAALKQALNYLVLQGQRSQVEEGQNVPWISLRTYSSTGQYWKRPVLKGCRIELIGFPFLFAGYFPNTSSTSNAATTFSELTPKLLDSLTFELESQVDAFLSSRVMSAKELKEHIENGTKAAKPSSTASSSSSSTATGSNRRRKSESESLRRALEEIAVRSSSPHSSELLHISAFLSHFQALYDWDRPNMQSPVKVSSRSHRKSTDAGSSRLSLGVGKNRIYIVTKLPRNEEELKRFLLYEKKTSSLTVLEKNICNNVFNGQHLNRAFR